MRRIAMFLMVMLLAFLQTTFAQRPIVNNLGAGRDFDKLLYYTYNEKDSLFYIGSDPNGHLYEYIPFTDSLHDCGKTRDDGLENYVWSLCVDEDGVVYGGTCQSRDIHIFKYYPKPLFPDTAEEDRMRYVELNGINDSFIWCSVATPDSFVYFGTDGGGRGKLIKYNKATGDWYDVFETLNYSATPFSRPFVEGHCSPMLFDFLEDHSPNSYYPGELKIKSLAVGPEGKIYGGTGNGFVFAYDPGIDTLVFFNVNEEAYPGDSTQWNTGAIGDIASDGNRVFLCVYGSSFVGTIELNLFSEPHERHLPWPNNPNLKVFGSHLKIIGDSLYIAAGGCVRYNMVDSTSAWLGWKGFLYTHFNYNGIDYLAGFGGELSKTHQTFSVRQVRGGSSQSTTIFSAHDPSEGDQHPRFRSIAADNSGNVCGGLYFGGDFVRHRVSDDFQSPSVEGLGYCGGANADAAVSFATGNYIYYGYYDGLGLGIFDATICDGPEDWHPQYNYSIHEPNSSNNPLQRHLRNGNIYNSGGGLESHTISSDLKRVNCFAADTNHSRLYIGTGPSVIEPMDTKAWIIRYDTAIDTIVHLFELKPRFGDEGVTGLGGSIVWVEDMDLYNDTLLFVLGKGENRTAIINIRDSTQGVALHDEAIAFNCVQIDPAHNKVFVSMASPSSQFRIYNLSGVVDSGFASAGYTSGSAGGDIRDIMWGNDGRIYVGYGDSIGVFDDSNVFHPIAAEIHDFPDHPSNHGVYRMTASADQSNQRLYIGALDGHMYVVFRENFVTITSAGSDSATEDYPFSYVATAASVDSIPPTIRFEHFPSWMNVSGDTIWGTPEEGGYDTSFVVIATDGVSSDTLEVTLGITDILTGPIEDSLKVSSNAILTEDVLIDTNGVLIIEPGVSIYAYPDTDAHNIGINPSKIELICRGRINAFGNAGDTVRFLPFASAPNNDDWRGLRLEQNAACSLSYCQIIYAMYGIELKHNAHAKINHSDMRFNQYGIGCLDTARIEISNSVLNYNANDGIHNMGYLTARGCTFVGNETYGIHGYMSKNNAVTNSAIDSNGTAGIFCDRGYLTVDSSVFLANDIYGVYGYHSDVDVGYSRFVGNNAYGIKLDGYATSKHLAEITYDTISATASYINGCGIYIANLDNSHVYKCKSRGFPLAGLFLNGSDTKVERNDFLFDFR